MAVAILMLLDLAIYERRFENGSTAVGNWLSSRVELRIYACFVLHVLNTDQ